MKKIILYLLLLCVNLNLVAQTNIYLKSTVIDYSKEFNVDFSEENNYCFMVFDVIPNDAQKLNLQSFGVTILEYLPRNTFLVNLPTNFNINLLNNYGVLKIINVLPEYKIDPKIQNNIFPQWALKNNLLSIKVIFYQDADINQTMQKFNLAGYDFRLQDFKNSSIQINIEKNDLIKIASINEVWFIEPIDPPSVPENKTARTLHRSNSINTNIIGGNKYNGEGINIMMQDDGLVGPHIDRQGRLDQSNCNGCSSNINNDH